MIRQRQKIIPLGAVTAANLGRIKHPVRPGGMGVQIAPPEPPRGHECAKLGVRRHSHFFHLKYRYVVTADPSIRTSATGYPQAWANSGMCTKFIP